MGRALLIVLWLGTAATVVPAAASEAVIRGGTITTQPIGSETPAYSGSSAPSSGPVTVLRGSLPPNPTTPASDLGGDVDGPVYNPPCLYTNPPTCR
jgi:hypothetical protein